MKMDAKKKQELLEACLIFLILLSNTQENIQECAETHQHNHPLCNAHTRTHTKECCTAELIQRLMLHSLSLKPLVKKEPSVTVCTAESTLILIKYTAGMFHY